MQQKGLELKGEIDRNESRIHFNEERLREFGSQNSKALAEIAQTEERKQLAEQESATVSEQLATSTVALEEHRKALASKQESLRQVEEDARRLQETLRQAQADAFAAAQDFSRVKNEITALDLQKQGNVVRLEKLSAEKIQLEEERCRMDTRLQEFAANVEAQKLNAETQRGSVVERQKRLVEIHQELDRAGKEQDQVLQQQAEKRSRLNVLEQLQAGHEGFSAGSLAALKQSEHVLGSLADKISVPDEFVTAIETALGQHLQLVLTEQPESAHQILADLNTNKRGRASVAPLAFVRNASGDFTVSNLHEDAQEISGWTPSPSAPVQLNGVPLCATAVVESDESVRPLIERLLGMTRIVRDLAAATEAWRESRGAFHYVTLTGELLNRHGVYTGGYINGAGNGKAPASILGRKNQIAELRSLLAKLQDEVAVISRQKGALQSEQTELQAGLQQAQTELQAQEVAIATREGEFNALQNSKRLLHQKIDTVVYEVQSLAAQEQEGAQKRAELMARAADLEAKERARQNQVAELTTGLEGLRQQRDLANAALTESKVALATEEQMSASFEQRQQSLVQRVHELAQIIEQRRGEIASFLTRKEQAEKEIQVSRNQIIKLQHDREQVNSEAAGLLAEKQTQEIEITGREEALREERRRLSEWQEQRSTIDVELAQKNMATQNLRERIAQKYHVKLDDIRSECITITFADEGAAKVHVMTPEEMAASGAATDWNVVSEQVVALQQRIDEMGPVNLVAIEEYEETEQRFQFLSKQHDDLVEAKTQLMDVINRINAQTQTLFRETFEKIRDNFRSMFTEVFGGGKADLVLMDENDLLESGIEIVARPPGKQLQTISLLSGGEQTMTAVALLFSIYQVKPSPFCVLDELDAPLDESNINRFIRVLQRFLEHSQFIIITHNKRTIGMADVLYGVTMQEQGVSRIVSVRFHKADEVVTDHKPASLETPTNVRPVEPEEDAPHKREDTLEIMMAK
jgi:chromosome segregation protein